MSRLSPRRVVHVQLAEPLGPLAVGCDGRGVYAVFWVGDLALGHEYFDVEELPLDPAELAAIAAAAVAPAVARRLSPAVARYTELAATEGPLQELGARAEASPEPGPPTSVVVLADDNPDGLTHCLRSLQRSTVRPEGVVVVHYGKDHSSTAAVCSAFGHPLHQPGRRSTCKLRWSPSPTTAHSHIRTGSVPSPRRFETRGWGWWQGLCFQSSWRRRLKWRSCASSGD